MLVPLGVAPAYSDAKWPKDLAGAIELWVELGHPDERVLAKAIGRSERVVVYTYSARPELWWEPIRRRFEGERRLSVFHVDARSAEALGWMAKSSMSLQCSIQDGEIWFRDEGDGAVRVEIEET